MKPTALLLVDHGSRLAAANDSLEEVARLVRDARPDLVCVATAHMELARPDVREGLEACARAGAERVIVHPYFLAAGRHATEDIPQLVRQAATDYPSLDIAITSPLGPHPALVAAILDRSGL